MEPKEQISHQIDIINGSSKASQTYAQILNPIPNKIQSNLICFLIPFLNRLLEM